MKTKYGIVSLLIVFALLFSLVACNAQSGAAPQEDNGSYIEFSREGEVSRVPVEIVRGSFGNYSIATDPEYFTYTAGDGVDRFAYDAWNGELTVYYCVYMNNEFTMQQLADGLMHQNSDSYENSMTEQIQLGDYAATALYFDGYSGYSDYCMHFYLIESNDGCFVIETQFTREMYEGLYAQMRALFDTFTMLED